MQLSYGSLHTPGHLGNEVAAVFFNRTTAMNWNQELYRRSVEFERDTKVYYEAIAAFAHAGKLLRRSLRDLEKHYARKPPGVSIDPQAAAHLAMWRRLLP